MPGGAGMIRRKRERERLKRRVNEMPDLHVIVNMTREGASYDEMGEAINRENAYVRRLMNYLQFKGYRFGTVDGLTWEITREPERLRVATVWCRTPDRAWHIPRETFHGSASTACGKNIQTNWFHAGEPTSDGATDGLPPELCQHCKAVLREQDALEDQRVRQVDEPGPFSGITTS